MVVRFARRYMDAETILLANSMCAEHTTSNQTTFNRSLMTSELGPTRTLDYNDPTLPRSAALKTKSTLLSVSM